MKLDKLLEILQYRNMSVRDALWQLVPFPNGQLDGLIASIAEILRVLLLRVQLQKRHECLEESPPRSRSVRNRFD